MSYKTIGKGVVKRTERQALGIFVDGTGLDRAARRLEKKIEMANLLRGVCGGRTPVVARYYTIIPFEDDSRQRAYLDAVSRAGFSVVVKRLPPKNITRQVSVDPDMAADITAFSLGFSEFRRIEEHNDTSSKNGVPLYRLKKPTESDSQEETASEAPTNSDLKRVAIIVCPSRDLAYTISLANDIGAETVTADFGQFQGQDILKSASRWIDLSDSETIWRE